MIYPLAAAFLAGAVIAGGLAWEIQQGRHDAAQLAAIEQARETEVMRRKAANAGATQHEREKIVIREKFVPVIEEVERVVTQVVYRDRMCMDSDGVRILNDAARVTGTAGESGNPLPSPAATP
jgi:hypothetical protein